MGYEGRVLNQRGEPICGMRVSDGRNITVTDGSGFYFLPGYERTRMIYVCALTARMDDWYIHTEGREGPFDFHVEPAAVSSDFCFFHTSDTEIEGRKSNEWVWSARELVGKHRPAFFMHTGDLCRDDGVRRHCLVMNERTVGCPVRYAIGNHDYIGENTGRKSTNRFTALCGIPLTAGRFILRSCRSDRETAPPAMSRRMPCDGCKTICGWRRKRNRSAL